MPILTFTLRAIAFLFLRQSMRMTNVSLFTMDLSTHNSLNDKVICRLPFYLFQLHLLASPHFDYSNGRLS